MSTKVKLSTGIVTEHKEGDKTIKVSSPYESDRFINYPLDIELFYKQWTSENINYLR